MITEAWSDINRPVIINGFNVLHESSKERNFKQCSNCFDEDDNIPLSKLYRRLAPNTSMSDNEIAEWATGAAESSKKMISEDIIDIANCNTEAEDDETVEISVNIERVITSINTVIDWADSSLTLEDILFLRRIREKAVSEKMANL